MAVTDRRRIEHEIPCTVDVFLWWVGFVVWLTVKLWLWKLQKKKLRSALHIHHFFVTVPTFIYLFNIDWIHSVSHTWFIHFFFIQFISYDLFISRWFSYIKMIHSFSRFTVFWWLHNLLNVLGFSIFTQSIHFPHSVFDMIHYFLWLMSFFILRFTRIGFIYVLLFFTCNAFVYIFLIKL